MNTDEIKEFIQQYEPTPFEDRVLISNYSIISMVKKAYDMGAQDGKNLSNPQLQEYRITSLMLNQIRELLYNIGMRTIWIKAGEHGWVDANSVDEILDVSEDPFGRDSYTFLYLGQEYTSIAVGGSQPG